MTSNQHFMHQDAANRLMKIQQFLIQKGLDACLLSTYVNILYANGSVFNGYLYIPKEGEAICFVKRPVDFQSENVRIIRKPEQIPEILRETGHPLPQRMLLEGDEMSYSDWVRLQSCFAETEFHNGTHAIRMIRSIKTTFEIEQIRKSAVAHVKAYRRIPEIYRPGMTDLELSIEIERVMREEGNLGLLRSFGNMEAFMGSVLAGDNASVASPYDFALGGAGHITNPIGATGTKLVSGTSIMIDMCGNFTGYLDDLTRTFSIGKLSEKAYKAHQVSIDIVHRLEEELKEGIVCEDIWELSLSMAKLAGLADCYMGTKQQAKFVGHGVGLVINELPVLATKSKEILKPGMILAIEPKFVIEGVGAVGVEDTFLVKENGCEQLTILEHDIVDLTNNNWTK
jgi:Xaa-Pro aminopeptidase